MLLFLGKNLFAKDERSGSRTSSTPNKRTSGNNCTAHQLED
jgi:hypothetical protein